MINKFKIALSLDFVFNRNGSSFRLLDVVVKCMVVILLKSTLKYTSNIDNFIAKFLQLIVFFSEFGAKKRVLHTQRIQITAILKRRKKLIHKLIHH